MIADEMMARRDAGELIGRAVSTMISAETLQRRGRQMAGQAFPLVGSRGSGRVVRVGDAGLSLLVRGVRVDCTWDRLLSAWSRLVANHTLTVDELGGGSDAVGLVSLLAALQGDALTVIDADSLVALSAPVGAPIHQYADMRRRGL